MGLLATVDTLLRDRNGLYEKTAEGKGLGRLLGRLLLVFALTSALYGLGMGSFRLFHPEFFFADFEMTSAQEIVVRGRVAGMNPETHTVYTERGAALPPAGTIRFNTSLPSEACKVVSVTEEKDYTGIVLPQETALREANAWRIPLIVALKAPALFVLALLICAPALYVLNLAFNMRLHFMPVMTLMALALAATGTMLAVFVPIAALFSFVTENYHFMKIFHVAVFAIAGWFGVKVLSEGLARLAPEGIKGLRVLLCSWLLLYCLVGGQIAWTLKPFLGTPYLPATPPFRVESGNIYVSTFRSMTQVGR